eukprot:3725459-Pleurochrysis_carterae.AAC.2
MQAVEAAAVMSTNMTMHLGSARARQISDARPAPRHQNLGNFIPPLVSFPPHHQPLPSLPAISSRFAPRMRASAPHSERSWARSASAHACCGSHG